MRWSFSSPPADSTGSVSAPTSDPSSSRSALPPDHPPVPDGVDECPVSPEARSVWLSASAGPSESHPLRNTDAASASSASNPISTTVAAAAAGQVAPLGTTRVISSIPRGQLPGESSGSSHNASPEGGTDADGRWVYPSEQQFFNAMMRKNHKPRAEDMRTVVPIHNAVNEKAWEEVLAWEAGMGGDRCGGVRLSSFVGRPKDRTPKAWIMTMLGYTPPFDRHDWIVDRCGTQVRYVIDFYTGRSDPRTQAVSFYLDVRPAVDNWEGVRTRFGQWWR